MTSTANNEFIDFLKSAHGSRRNKSWRSRRFGRVVDLLFDAMLRLSPAYRQLGARMARMPVRKVLITSVDVPSRRADLDVVIKQLQASRHDITVKITPLGNRGKFQNINVGLEGTRLDDYDWLLVIDDDVSLQPRFLDLFLCVAELADLRLCQPAHRFRSYTSWAVTQRVWNSLAHVTHFVECGPITAFHRSTFADCIPFPDTRWAWGVDVLWGEIARRRGFRIGVVDATPIGHLREVAQSYDHQKAIDEANDLLEQNNVHRDGREIMKTLEIVRGF